MTAITLSDIIKGKPGKAGLKFPIVLAVDNISEASIPASRAGILSPPDYINAIVILTMCVVQYFLTAGGTKI